MVMHKTLPASFFGMVLGLSGLGQAWRISVNLWGLPSAVGESLLLLSVLLWVTLLSVYIYQAIWHTETTRQEFLHPVQGSTPALLAVSTLLIVLAVLPYSRTLAWILAISGISWHLAFSLWHTGVLWQGGRNNLDTTPALYIPTVAGNFTSAAALGGLGHADWGWLFLGAGIFSWLALESHIVQRLWQLDALPVAQRPLLGIQFAPPAVCAMAWMSLAPGSSDHWLLMLWGYGLFQLLLGLRLGKWLGAQPFSPSYWAYTFGIAAATVCCLKLALVGVSSAQFLAIPIFVVANIFIGYLSVRTALSFLSNRL